MDELIPMSLGGLGQLVPAYVVHYEESLVMVYALLRDIYPQLGLSCQQVKDALLALNVHPQWLYEDLCTGYGTPLLTRFAEQLGVPVQTFGTAGRNPHCSQGKMEALAQALSEAEAKRQVQEAEQQQAIRRKEGPYWKKNPNYWWKRR
jgi:hypothetical protein